MALPQRRIQTVSLGLDAGWSRSASARLVTGIALAADVVGNDGHGRVDRDRLTDQDRTRRGLRGARRSVGLQRLGLDDLRLEIACGGRRGEGRGQAARENPSDQE